MEKKKTTTIVVSGGHQGHPCHLVRQARRGNTVGNYLNLEENVEVGDFTEIKIIWEESEARYSPPVERSLFDFI